MHFAFYFAPRNFDFHKTSDIALRDSIFGTLLAY